MSKSTAIGVFAPSSPAQPESMQAGLDELARRGFSVKCPLDPAKLYNVNDFAKSGTFFGAGSATERVQSLMTLVDDPEVPALVAARGGYGSPELLPMLDLSRIEASKKVLVGGSDVTALLLALFGKTGALSIHGPMVATDFARSAQSPEAKENVDQLLRMLSGEEKQLHIKGTVLRAGKGEGPLLAGNLTMILSLLGTRWEPDFTGKILVIEDVGEAPFRMHRALNQLRIAGKLMKLSGVAFGRFSRCEAKAGATIEEVIRHSIQDVFAGTDFPVLADLPFGHGGRSVPLPIGAKSSIADATLTVSNFDQLCVLKTKK